MIRAALVLWSAALAAACGAGAFTCGAGCCACSACASPFQVAQACDSTTDTVCECPAGRFHAEQPERDRLPCPGPSNTSRHGATREEACTCRAGEMGLEAAQGVPLTLGAYSSSESVSCAAEGEYAGVFHLLKYDCTGSASVLSGALTVFACDLDCDAYRGVPVLLASSESAHPARLVVAHAGHLTLHRFTARAVSPTAFQGEDLASYAVTHQLVSGDYVFADTPTRSRARCVACPPGLACL